MINSDMVSKPLSDKVNWKIKVAAATFFRFGINHSVKKCIFMLKQIV